MKELFVLTRELSSRSNGCYGRDMNKKVTVYASHSCPAGHWTARRRDKEETKDCQRPHLPSHSTSSQVQWLIATPLFASYLTRETSMEDITTPLYQLGGDYSQLKRDIDLDSYRKQLTDVHRTQPVGQSCRVDGSQ
jgi:hypothetical protein